MNKGISTALLQILRSTPDESARVTLYMIDVIAALKLTSSSNFVPDRSRIETWAQIRGSKCSDPSLCDHGAP
jgi:hypothetical protein